MHLTYSHVRFNLFFSDGLQVRRSRQKRRTTMRKTAIVTGASRGIGRTIALRLAADGFGVVVNYAGNAAKAEEVVNEITSSGGRALAVQADVANPEDVKQLFEKTLKAFGQIDVVVNNAGIMPLSPIAKGDVETFDKVIATNLRGTFLVLSQAAQHVAEGCRIIAFSSSVLAKKLPCLRPLYRLQSRRRRSRPRPRQRASWTQNYRQRNRTWTCRYGALLGQQDRRANQTDQQYGATRTARPARRCRWRRLLPCRARWRMGQRSDTPRKWRLCINSTLRPRSVLPFT
jgi:NAD(P)-dependent dehydrogenase (short-subunit alcohol dehydrogenase family)